MAELLADCPRCRGARTTFDVKHAHGLARGPRQHLRFEAYCLCRHCKGGTIFLLEQVHAAPSFDSQTLTKGIHTHTGSISRLVRIERYISIQDEAAESPPQHIPPSISAAFREASTCLTVGCYNAAASMYRLCIDHATWGLLPELGVDGLTASTRRSLGFRLAWLFDSARLPEALRELSEAIKEDGNDGAHEGNLTKADAEDMRDFTVALLERLFTEPRRLELARERRAARRAES